MKVSNLIVFILFTSVLMSCKNESTTTAKSEEETIKENVSISLEVIVKKNDNFQVYYSSDEKESFTEEKSIWKEIVGSSSSQKVVFNLPANEIPHYLRLDFGLNKEQEDIVLSSIELDYFGSKRLIKGNEIAFFFRALEPTKMDFTTGIINAIDKDGNRVEPVLYPHEVPLREEIGKLLGKTK